jgi:hypothetical protein
MPVKFWAVFAGFGLVGAGVYLVQKDLIIASRTGIHPKFGVVLRGTDPNASTVVLLRVAHRC